MYTVRRCNYVLVCENLLLLWCKISMSLCNVVVEPITICKAGTASLSPGFSSLLGEKFEPRCCLFMTLAFE